MEGGRCLHYPYGIIVSLSEVHREHTRRGIVVIVVVRLLAVLVRASPPTHRVVEDPHPGVIVSVYATERVIP